jgi:hypothetical protein
MKLTIKFFLAILISIICLYAACKKTTSTVINNNAISLSSQVAVNLYKVLAGKFGGATINGGKVFSHNNLTINALNSLCGYRVDTIYSYKTILGDTTQLYVGHYKFIYTCSANTVDGYITVDSMSLAESGTRFANSYKVAQNYTVKTLNTNYQLLSVDGTITTANYTSVLNTAHAVVQYHDLNTTYNLQGVKVDITTGAADMTTGTATFNATQADLTSTLINATSSGYNGTITFLGNHKARVTIHIGADTSTLVVNLVTGAVSAI